MAMINLIKHKVTLKDGRVLGLTIDLTDRGTRGFMFVENPFDRSMEVYEVYNNEVQFSSSNMLQLSKW